MSIYKLLSPHTEKKQQQFIEAALEGEGTEWFHHNVERCDRLVHDWNVKSIIMALQQ